MTMERTIMLIVFYTAIERDIGEYIYISINKTWDEAKDYCKQYYTEYAFVSNQSDHKSLLKAAGENPYTGWIGLHRRADNSSIWMWSGGENVTYLNWDNDQPDNRGGKENAAQIWGNGKWNDCEQSRSMPFYCISVPKVEGKMSWEEALEHCRGTDRDLPSLLSEVQHLDAQKLIQLENITDLVWIGLRFLNDRWLWMNGDPLVYEAWAQGDQDHLCPIQKRCGALSKAGLWKNWDCQDKLNYLCI